MSIHIDEVIAQVNTLEPTRNDAMQAQELVHPQEDEQRVMEMMALAQERRQRLLVD